MLCILCLAWEGASFLFPSFKRSTNRGSATIITIASGLSLDILLVKITGIGQGSVGQTDILTLLLPSLTLALELTIGSVTTLKGNLYPERGNMGPSEPVIEANIEEQI